MIPDGINPAAVFTFGQVAKMLVESEKAKPKRKQLTQTSFDNLQLRLNKLILPHFGLMDVQSINYKCLNEFLQKLSTQQPPLSLSTIGAYMGLVRKVMLHAARHSYLPHLPEFPRVGVEDKPRGWFNVGEYHAINRMAKKLAGKRIEWRAHSDKPGESYFCMPGEMRSP